MQKNSGRQLHDRLFAKGERLRNSALQKLYGKERIREHDKEKDSQRERGADKRRGKERKRKGYMYVGRRCRTVRCRHLQVHIRDSLSSFLPFFFIDKHHFALKVRRAKLVQKIEKKKRGYERKRINRNPSLDIIVGFDDF